MITIQTITQPTLEDFQPLIDASTREGYDFVQKLWDEYQSGENAFDERGAVLLGGYADQRLVAVGGVHIDPYLNQPTIGRIRHVYVLPEYRRSGAGKKLVQALIDSVSDHFSTFTLRTMTAHGDAFYKALGFTAEARFAESTHWLDVQPLP